MPFSHFYYTTQLQLIFAETNFHLFSKSYFNRLISVQLPNYFNLLHLRNKKMWFIKGSKQNVKQLKATSLILVTYFWYISNKIQQTQSACVYKRIKSSTYNSYYRFNYCNEMCLHDSTGYCPYLYYYMLEI